MTPRQIEAFREVVLQGSLTAAALTLNISQPAVSRMIRDMTEEVGFALFERHKGRMRPTGPALMLFQEVERSFVGLDQIRQAAVQIQQLESGRLRVAAMPVLGSFLLPEASDRFLGANPTVAFHIEVHSSPMIVQLLREQQVDIGFVQSDMVPLYVAPERRIHFDGPCVCAFHRDHPFAEKEVISLGDLDGESVIELNKQSVINRKLNTLCNNHGVNIGRRLQVSWFQLACNFVARGHGVAIVDLLSATYYRDPNFVYRPIQFPINYEFDLMYPPISSVNPLAKSFVEEVISLMPREVSVQRVEGY
ncbi:LysR substrate-binding domain-containing protein [Marinobacterium lutimaris]|uniref:Transcriptional regulator, LysR family n=1 Tax=Marinobacterium lutimaris TaxID=568106 RepID=A0A1H5TR23_9GAMM|nr:LysR substrate-binding domain-containing protein [Marinobacterium lutimaris]SEF65233.1 transcriptional regulator, LysR family [Marinobacterium lutimaris]